MSPAGDNKQGPSAEQTRKRTRTESDADEPSAENNDLVSASAAHMPLNGTLHRREMVVNDISHSPSRKPSAWMIAEAEEACCQALWAQGHKDPISADYFYFQVDRQMWLMFGDKNWPFPYGSEGIQIKGQPASLTYRWYCTNRSLRIEPRSGMPTKDHVATPESTVPSNTRRLALWNRHFSGLKTFVGGQPFEIPMSRLGPSGYAAKGFLDDVTKSLDNVIVHLTSRKKPFQRIPRTHALIWLKKDDGSRNFSQTEILQLKLAWNVMVKVVLHIKENKMPLVSDIFSSVMSDAQDDIDRSTLVSSALLGMVDDSEATAKKLEGKLEKGTDGCWHTVIQQDSASGVTTGGGAQGEIAAEEPVLEGDVKIVDEVVTRIISESRAPADSGALKAISSFALSNPQGLKLSCLAILEQALKTWKAKQATGGIVPKAALEILRH